MENNVLYILNGNSFGQYSALVTRGNATNYLEYARYARPYCFQYYLIVADDAYLDF